MYKSLYIQVITAILIGVILGYLSPQTGEAMKPLGDAFIKLIKMIIAPIIFCTVVVGIAGEAVGKARSMKANRIFLPASIVFVAPGTQRRRRVCHRHRRDRTEWMFR